MAVLLALGLAGCAVGPNYRPPPLGAPARWTAPADTSAPDPAVLAEWWRQFGDPVLDRLVTEALAANLNLATARAQLRQARALRNLAWAQLGPQVDASFSASRSRSGGGGVSGTHGGGDSTVELYSAGFDAKWELDVFGGLRRGAEAAAADLGASLESLRDTRVSLVAEVVRNYVDLRTAQNRLGIAESSLAAFGETYDLARWRLQAGLASELDVAQARTELESTRATVPPLRTAMEAARHRLAVLLGRPPGELQYLLEGAPPAVPVAGRAAAVGIPADTLRHRPDVRAAERRVAAQTARLGQAEAARFPTFNLSGSVGLEALTLSGLTASGAGTNSLLGGITAPIFQSGRITANIEAQNALLEQAVLAYRSAVLTALEDVENALVAVANTSERRGKLTLAADSARETLQIAQQRYASGLTDFLSVLDSQRTLLNLEDQLASSSGEVATAQVQLYKALGGGWSPGPESSRKEKQ
ncbi:MAG: efflux transporter outer membrane subunit [Desulfobacteraceae bacterium]|nr:efflux transporter outer membrane subunit [Desulfobacteraceae bacterium]